MKIYILHWPRYALKCCKLAAAFIKFLLLQVAAFVTDGRQHSSLIFAGRTLRFGFWDHIHNTFASSKLMNWPNKLEC
jgi:hypothetical protein